MTQDTTFTEDMLFVLGTMKRTPNAPQTAAGLHVKMETLHELERRGLISSDDSITMSQGNPRQFTRWYITGTGLQTKLPPNRYYVELD